MTIFTDFDALTAFIKEHFPYVDWQVGDYARQKSFEANAKKYKIELYLGHFSKDNQPFVSVSNTDTRDGYCGHGGGYTSEADIITEIQKRLDEGGWVKPKETQLDIFAFIE